MSFILEALKKSQQERERGEIPNLETKPNRVSPQQPNTFSPWNLTGILLGLIAILIAAYGTFGKRWFETTLETAEMATAAPKQMTEAGDSGELSLSLPSPSKTGVRNTPDAGRQAAATVTENRPASSGKPAIPDDKGRQSTVGGDTPIETGATVSAETDHTPSSTKQYRPSSPLQADSSLTASAVPSGPVVTEQPASNIVPEPAPDDTPATLTTRQALLREEAERLRQRLLKLDAEETSPRFSSVTAPVETLSDKSTAKQKNESGSTKLGLNRQHLPTNPPLPTDLELPDDVYESLPARRVLVHVYTQAPETRFIILNSTKLKTGDTTPEGLLLEEILPDGMIFRYREHRFLQPK
jgi:general secretion pathway protein B